MLQCTPAAVDVLRDARRTQGIADTCGIRIDTVATSGGQSVKLEFVPAPVEGDVVSAQHGEDVYVGRGLASDEDLILDVQSAPTSDGRERPGLVLRRTGAPN